MRAGSIEPQTCIEELRARGYTHIPGLLSESDTKELQNISHKLLAQQQRVPWSSSDTPEYRSSYRKPVFGDENWSVLTNVIGLSREFDRLLESMLTDRFLKELFLSILGPSYKLWQANIRRSEVGDRGLGLHQDSEGETGLAVFLSDMDSRSGTTVFLYWF